METGLRTENAINTGDIYQAILPFNSPQGRATLEYYAGPAVVVNQRAACFAPTLDNIALIYKLNDGSAAGGLYLNASIAVENQTDFIRTDPSKLGQITCRIHNGWFSIDPFLPPISLCSSVANTLPIKNGTENPLSGWAYGFNLV
ncbi:hypothetical protein FOXG_18369 [Fusarium oxysporum f. sp. lycopersici 4287]|uniref:Uncharacterized protein n=1 Tax=Fusarium oxysporum f. sp. lycopersici (strain 4287 / CBS 123668 / FGSC 9935 / NRRL 34936) TaxID=426428 RepID=A0A0J9UJD3_FUSO4|nr:hypothetical protein FOXG_18369 [Fusarium oxysporum f. sp. lycopersici 4287]KAJ9425944.1 hypothetical protein QL093DRAFT_2079708 [Fusarium oxysporum]KNA98250.1 hypothetical protein FOXG_18369 [Fusarium oxysporum f. sp. lycopersici 4287]